MKNIKTCKDLEYFLGHFVVFQTTAKPESKILFAENSQEANMQVAVLDDCFKQLNFPWGKSCGMAVLTEPTANMDKMLLTSSSLAAGELKMRLATPDELKHVKMLIEQDKAHFSEHLNKVELLKDIEEAIEINGNFLPKPS